MYLARAPGARARGRETKPSIIVCMYMLLVKNYNNKRNKIQKRKKRKPNYGKFLSISKYVMLAKSLDPCEIRREQRVQVRLQEIIFCRSRDTAWGNYSPDERNTDFPLCNATWGR